MNAFNRRHFLQHTAALAATAAAGRSAWAADAFPTKPLVLMVPYPAGGASDVAARIYSEFIARSLQQQVVVENLGGGTGLIAANKVLAAPADGYMFFHGSANEIFLAPMLNPSARYKPADFTLAAPLTEAPIVLMVKSNLPVNSYDEFVEYARTRKDKPLGYGTVGIDSMYHLIGDALAAQLKFPFLHVPYKGGAPALQDLAGGQVDCAILPYQTSFDAMAKQGRLKILTSFSKVLPEPLKHIPLISQSKISPDFEHTIGSGHFVKKGTPPERVAVLRGAITQALRDPAIRARLEQEGKYIPQPVINQQQSDQRFAETYQRIRGLVESVGRKPLA
ncbi:MAG: tripartite tricarboxylate transporter substrate binding protein [Comamonas sp.]